MSRPVAAARRRGLALAAQPRAARPGLARVSLMSASERRGWVKLVLCAAGIYGAYLTQGVVQEELATKRCTRGGAALAGCVCGMPVESRSGAYAAPRLRRYGAANERFTHIVFLNLAQSVFCLCWAGLWLLLRPPAKDSASCRMFLGAAVSNTLGPACGVIALKNIRRARAQPPDAAARLLRLLARTAIRRRCWQSPAS